MELRSRPGINGSQTKPRATSEGRKAVGLARGGKSPSRILPTEGGRSRAFGPQPRSESAGGADRSPEEDPPRRLPQTRESGDVGGRATPGRKPGVVAAESGKHPRQPDEGRTEFTHEAMLLGVIDVGEHTHSLTASPLVFRACSSTMR